MLKSKVLILIVALMLVFSMTSVAFADTEPVLPQLKLTVQQSPLTVYPPIMIYTAQLSSVPIISNTNLVASFYNIDPYTNTPVLLGTATFDQTGKAVLSKQMKPGKYIGVAKTVINNVSIISNTVNYIVY